MTDCTVGSLRFASVDRRQVVADFRGGDLTSDGGLPLVREVDRRTGLLDALNSVIADPRNPLHIQHDQRTMLAQRVYAIAAAYEDLNDHNALRHDTLLQALTERRLKLSQQEGDPLASPSTLCRLENRLARRDLVGMAKVFIEQFISSHDAPPEQVVLDFDSTDDPVHGRQEGRFFHGYYDEYCFLPLYVFCGDQLLAAYLRTADGDGARHSWAILKLLVDRFRKAWPSVKIIFRADSGFCRWRMMRWCDRHRVDYIIGLARNQVLERMAQAWTDQAQELYQATGQKQRIFNELSYAAQSWDRPRRVLVKAEYGDKGDNPRFVVTSLQGTPQELYEKLYCQRGDAENRIKEQQLCLFADRTSCHSFLANQFRVLLSAAAYVLVETLRRVGLVGTELAQAQVDTIRLKVLKIGARVVRSVRRIVLHLTTAYPLADLLAGVLRRLQEWRCLPAPSP